MNHYWYKMFRDHTMFEALIVCNWELAIGDISQQYENKFDEEDLKWLVGAGGDEFQKFCEEMLEFIASHPSDLFQAVTEERVQKV
jgi:hypothetical protein